MIADRNQGLYRSVTHSAYQQIFLGEGDLRSGSEVAGGGATHEERLQILPKALS